jgi:hypothetical protein
MRPVTITIGFASGSDPFGDPFMMIADADYIGSQATPTYEDIGDSSMYTIDAQYINNGYLGTISNVMRYGPPQDPVHGPWLYGHFCGMGGSGSPIEGLDNACAHHDMCYYTHGSLTATSNLLPANPDLQARNQKLCDAASNVIAEGGPNTTAAWSIYNFFTLVPRRGNACH